MYYTKNIMLFGKYSLDISAMIIIIHNNNNNNNNAYWAALRRFMYTVYMVCGDGMYGIIIIIIIPFKHMNLLEFL